MRLQLGLTTLPLVVFSGLAGCASADPEDALATEAGDGVALAGATSDTYFSITADLRRCASPYCGGWLFANLNREMTRCHDGRLATSCYTPVLDWSGAGLADADQARLIAASNEGAASGAVYAIVRGRFARTNHTTPHPELGKFLITEAWVGENGAIAEGAFVQIKDNGMRCFVAPCPNLTETTLNTSTRVDIADVDWSWGGFTEAQVTECNQAMYSPAGIVVAGYRYTVSANGNTAMGRTATAAYLRLTSAP
jgi:hypothetical protein